MSLSFSPMIFTYQFWMKSAQKPVSSNLTSRTEKWHESASFCCFSTLCLWLVFHGVLQTPQRGLRALRQGVLVLGEWLLPPSALHGLPQIHFFYWYTLFLYSFNSNKVVLLTECSDDVAWYTGGAVSIWVCCSDSKLILGVWKKSFENHGLHLDLLSYYRPIAVKVWPSGSNKAKIINN